MKPVHQPIHLLLISGSRRDGSTTTAVLNTVPMLAGDGVESVLYGGMAELPHFNPDDEREGQPAHAAVTQLRAEVAAALEWSVGGAGTYRSPSRGSTPLDPPRRPAHGTHDSLHNVLSYVHVAIVEAACTRMPVRLEQAEDPDDWPAMAERPRSLTLIGF